MVLSPPQPTQPLKTKPKKNDRLSPRKSDRFFLVTLSSHHFPSTLEVALLATPWKTGHGTFPSTLEVALLATVFRLLGVKTSLLPINLRSRPLGNSVSELGQGKNFGVMVFPSTLEVALLATRWTGQRSWRWKLRLLPINLRSRPLGNPHC